MPKVKYAEMFLSRKKRKRSSIFAYRIALLRKLAWIDFKLQIEKKNPYPTKTFKYKTISREEFEQFIIDDLGCSKRTAEDYAKFLCHMRL